MATNYMGMKTEELEKLMVQYDLDPEDFKNEKGALNRKRLSNFLRVLDVQVGKAKEAVSIDEKGEVREHNAGSSKLHKSLSGMMVQVTFYNSDENDLPYVQLGLNGIALVMPREQKVWIPKEFVDGVLQNAITTKMKMDVTREGKIRYIPKQIPRLQHTVHDMKHIDVLRKEYDEAKKEK